MADAADSHRPVPPGAEDEPLEATTDGLPHGDEDEGRASNFEKVHRSNLPSPVG